MHQQPKKHLGYRLAPLANVKYYYVGTGFVLVAITSLNYNIAGYVEVSDACGGIHMQEEAM